MENWKPATYNQVICAYLKAEAYRLVRDGVNLNELQRKCIADPDLENVEENEARRALVFYSLGRAAILQSVPGDTLWYEASLRESDLYTNVFVFFSKHWLTLAPHRFLNLEPPDKWAPPILWAHSQEGPFTILEGNTRLTQAAAAYRAGEFRLPVYVGLSTAFFQWHTPDTIGLCAH